MAHLIEPKSCHGPTQVHLGARQRRTEGAWQKASPAVAAAGGHWLLEDDTSFVLAAGFCCIVVNSWTKI
jgi:hypothetical protein